MATLTAKRLETGKARSAADFPRVLELRKQLDGLRGRLAGLVEEDRELWRNTQGHDPLAETKARLLGATAAPAPRALAVVQHERKATEAAIHDLEGELAGVVQQATAAVYEAERQVLAEILMTQVESLK